MIDPAAAPHFTLEELTEIMPPDTEPTDFEDFWQTTYKVASQIDLEIHMKPLWSPTHSWHVYDVSYTSWDSVRIGAWMVVPEHPKGLLVAGHGYGGRAWFEPTFPDAGFISIFPCIRGFHLSSHPEIPWEGHAHVLHNIQNKDAYVIRGSVVDLWLAASVVLGAYPQLQRALYYSGGSFGGGLGALMLPWDARFRAAHLEVPTFGHHPKRLEIPSTGSAEAVRLYTADHPEVPDVLAYYDAATAASKIATPTLCSPALYDPAVTPPGQFAVANALERGETFVLPTGHFETPETTEVGYRLEKKVLEFFDEH